MFKITRVYQAFCRQLIPLLIACQDYLCALEKQDPLLPQKKINIEKILQSNTDYPEWVYNVGFNPGLRAGYRFFLVKLDMLIETVFSLNSLLIRVTLMPEFSSLHESIFMPLEKNKALLEVIINTFENQPLKAVNTDYISDMIALEKSILAIFPHRLDINSSHEELDLWAYSQNLKDLRGILLELVSALPKQDS